MESDAKQKGEADGGAKNGRHIGRGVCIFSYAMFVVGGFFSYLGGGRGAAGRRTRSVVFFFLVSMVSFVFSVVGCSSF